MIFKTITDVNGKTKTGLNDIFSGLFTGDFFKPQNFSLSEILSESDIEAIKNYNSELEKVISYTTKQGKVIPVTQSAQTAYNRTMLEASDKAKDVVAAANGEKVAFDNLTKSSKAAELGMKALAIAGNMIAMWALSEAITLIYNCATASDRLRESASKLGSEFASTGSDISEYKKRISELRSIIDDSNSSYEDSYNAREDLLGIQDELIEKYGTEAESIKLITDAVNGSINALDLLTQYEWNLEKAKYSADPDRKWYTKAADWIVNKFNGVKNNFDAMIKEVEDTSVAFTIEPEYDNEAYNKFAQKLEQEFNATKYISGAGDKFYLTGNLNDLKDQLVQIQSLAKDLGFEDNISRLTSEIARVQSAVEDYDDIYNQYILYDKILNSDNGYEEYYREATDAYKKYNEAQKSGDQDVIDESRQNYVELIESITSNFDKDSEKGIIDFFNEMYPDLQAEVGKWEFNVKFNAALNDDTDDFENKVKDALSKFNTIEDLKDYRPSLGTDDQTEARNYLQGLASEYNMSDEEFYDKLLEMNLINSQAKIDLAEKISKGITDQEDKTRQAIVDDAKQNLEDEYQKISDWSADGAAIWGDETSSIPYILPEASESVLGGIKVGTNLSIDNGVLSASIGSKTVYQSVEPTELFTNDSWLQEY